MAAARRGDGAAFAELLRPHYQPAFRVAYGLLHDSTEAEDAVQEAAFKAWRLLGNLREGASLRPWFLAIVANECRGTSQSKWWSVSKKDEFQGTGTDQEPGRRGRGEDHRLTQKSGAGECRLRNVHVEMASRRCDGLRTSRSCLGSCASPGADARCRRSSRGRDACSGSARASC